MKYVFLIYQEQPLAGAHEPSQRDDFVAEAADYRQQLRQCGQLLMALALPPATLTVRPHGGALEIGAEPGLTASANLTAIWLTEARDLNEAIRLAARMPEARLGRVEVRPLAGEECAR